MMRFDVEFFGGAVVGATLGLIVGLAIGQARADCPSCSSGTTTLIVQPIKSYVWDPQPDITAYELARALPIALGYGQGNVMRVLENSPPEVRRHFKEVTK